jgi:hypothetical protein
MKTKFSFTLLLALVIFLGTQSTLKAGGLNIATSFYGSQISSTNNTVNANGFFWGNYIINGKQTYYRYKLVRTAHNFSLQNLAIKFNSNGWPEGSYQLISNNTNNNRNINTIQISGKIPAIAYCGDYEKIEIIFYLKNENGNDGIAFSRTLTFFNPGFYTSFNFNGSCVPSPNVVTINYAFPPFPAMVLKYMGIGHVVKYKLFISAATSAGIPIPGGACSDSSWHNGAVPASNINVRSISGGSFGSDQLLSSPGYYLITLKTQGTTCSGIFKTLIRTRDRKLDTSQHHDPVPVKKP